MKQEDRERIRMVRDRLSEWAYWRAHAVWPDACNLGRIHDAGCWMPPGSRMPPGAWIPPWMVETMLVLDKVASLDDRHRQAVSVTCLWYLCRWYGCTVTDIAMAAGISRRSVGRYRELAEAAISRCA